MPVVDVVIEMDGLGLYRWVVELVVFIRRLMVNGSRTEVGNHHFVGCQSVADHRGHIELAGRCSWLIPMSCFLEELAPRSASHSFVKC